MALKNIVTAGDYKGGRVELKVKLFGSNEVSIIKPWSFGGKVIINKDTVEGYEVLDSESNTSTSSAVARGAIGTAILGPVGMASALSAKKKGMYTVAIQFKDGKRSLVEVDNDIYKEIQRSLF